MTKLDKKLCSNCGHENKPLRIDKGYIKTEIQSLVSFEKGFLHSIKELLVNPRRSITAFFYDDRQGLVKPITFIIFCTTISILVNSIFTMEPVHIEISKPQEEISKTIVELIDKNKIIIDRIFDYQGILNVCIAIFMAMWLKLFLRKTKYNFFEILVLVSYTIGIGILLSSIEDIIEWSTNKRIAIHSMLLVCIFSGSMIGRFLGEKKIMNYLKGSISYLLGLITFLLILLLTLLVLVFWDYHFGN